jgi:cysteine synthase A
VIITTLSAARDQPDKRYRGDVKTPASRSRWCAAKGYPLLGRWPRRSPWSAARTRAWREGDLTLAAERGIGMVRLAAALAEKHGWFLARQFQNPANPAFHRQTTGPEILKDFAARRLDYWVTGWGTGGTLNGAGEMIKLARPEVTIIATEPAGASLLGGKEWAPHKIQGWTPDFLPDVLNPKVFDQLLPVTDEEGKQMARRLAREEGIFVGISSGATLAAAVKAAETAKPGSVLLAMLPDTGERYLGTYLFDDLNAGSDDEWLASLDKK